MRKNDFGSREQSVLYVRIDADVMARLRQIADRPPDGGEPESLACLVGRVLGRFVGFAILKEEATDERQKAISGRGEDTPGDAEGCKGCASCNSPPATMRLPEAGIRGEGFEELKA